MKENPNRNASTWWRDLSRVYGVGLEEKWFDKNIEWKIGDCAQIRFWGDRWVGEDSLASNYPRLYHVSNNEQATLKEMGIWENDNWIWELEWRRRRLEWEIQLNVDGESNPDLEMRLLN